MADSRLPGPRPRLGRLLPALAALWVLSACVATRNSDAPASALQPWAPPAVSADWRELAVAGPAADRPEAGDRGPALQPGRDYDLAALIDLAQRNNPATRVAWMQARQAATTVGITEAVFLPMLSAYVVGGQTSGRIPLPDIGGRTLSADTSASGVVPLITLQWLLFDFGQRSAAREAARNLSLGSNFLFNGAHQKLVYDVTRTFYEYGAARDRAEVARESMRNSQGILSAVLARRGQGLATSIEEAQVRQQVAQASLRVVTAEGAQRNAYQALAAAVGIEPEARVRVASIGASAPPTFSGAPDGSVFRQALANRPDVMASVASLKAAEQGVEAARAEFMPKVFLSAFASGGRSALSVGGLPGLNGQQAANGVLVGVALPLYDAGLRDARLRDAQDRVGAAEATLSKLRTEALREMIVATNLLETAVQAYEAAGALVETATLTHDAATDAYRHGVGTVTASMEAANGLLAARAALTDAHASALIAAATLAFALGRLDGASAAAAAPAAPSPATTQNRK